MTGGAVMASQNSIPKSEGEFSSGLSRAPYWQRSRRPVEILVFLLPLVIAFELALIWSPDHSAVMRIAAYRWVESMFVAMGAADFGLAIPGILMVVALLVWQVLTRESWRFHLPTIPVMGVESILLAIPLLIVGVILGNQVVVEDMAQAMIVPGSILIDEPPSFVEMIAMAIGAGLYEELIFRWVLIAILHSILADGFKIASRTAAMVAAVISSLLFMLAHDPDTAGAALFFLVGGMWFSSIYLVRGFGLAAGAHVAYDVMWSVTAWFEG